MIAAYELHRNTLAEKLHSLDDVTCNHQAWMIVGEQEILLKDTVGGLLWLALFDAVHHHGQFITYIRPMCGKFQACTDPLATTLEVVNDVYWNIGGVSKCLRKLKSLSLAKAVYRRRLSPASTVGMRMNRLHSELIRARLLTTCCLPVWVPAHR